MRKLLFLVLLCYSPCSFAHEFFFAFAEVEYNELTGKLEASITVTTHDLEKHLKLVDPSFKNLHQAERDSNGIVLIEKEINDHFYFSISEDNSTLDGAGMIYLKLDGFETSLNGTVNLYLSTEINTQVHSLDATFDLLMEDFPEQQNKLTFIYRGKKTTHVFLPNQRTQLIELIQP